MANKTLAISSMPSWKHRWGNSGYGVKQAQVNHERDVTLLPFLLTDCILMLLQSMVASFASRNHGTMPLLLLYNRF